jgi:hypothetical protein
MSITSSRTGIVGSTAARQGALAAAFGALASGLLVMTLGSGAVSAPEPADLTAPLSGSPGATAAATYVYSRVSTRVLLWPGVWTSGGTAAAGTPCSTYGLFPGDRATKTIIVSGSLRKCA